jgi:hypothetical protein
MVPTIYVGEREEVVWVGGFGRGGGATATSGERRRPTREEQTEEVEQQL